VLLTYFRLTLTNALYGPQVHLTSLYDIFNLINRFS
jgi:hypothetical protein